MREVRKESYELGHPSTHPILRNQGSAVYTACELLSRVGLGGFGMRFIRLFRILLAVGAFLLLGSCGGGSTPDPEPPPPPPGFNLVLSTDLITSEQGTFIPAIHVSAELISGFDAPIEITFLGLPSDVYITGPTPLLLSSSNRFFSGFGLQVEGEAPIGTHPITVQATSVGLTRNQTVTLTIIEPRGYVVTITPTSVTLKPGERVELSVSVSPSEVFADDRINVRLLTLPAGVEWTMFRGDPPFSSSTIFPGETWPIHLDATPFAQPTNVQRIAVTGDVIAGRSVVDSFSLTVDVPFPTSSPPTRSTFRRTDEDVTRLVYDPIRGRVFATVLELNKVEVFGAEGTHLASIPVPQPFGIDITADGSKIIVGTQTDFIHVIDPISLQVIERVPFPPINGADHPEGVVTLSNGTVLLRARQGRTTFTLPVQWDPATNTFTRHLPFGQLQSPVGMARSADHSTAIFEGGDNGGRVFLFDSATNSFTAANELRTNIGSMAISPDGSQIAIASGGIKIFDRQLQLQRALDVPRGGNGMVYSPDGQFLFVGNDQYVTTYDANTYEVLGLVPNVEVGRDTIIRAADETGMLFGSSFKGIAFVDAASPRHLSIFAPRLSVPNAVAPPRGTLNSPAPTTVTGGEFSNLSGIFFGSPPSSGAAAEGTDITVVTDNSVMVTPPSSTEPGPANVTLTTSDGWDVIAPDGYTYGPHVLFTFPNAGPPEGGTVVPIRGYGFVFDGSGTTIQIGNNQATVTGQGVGRPIPYPFPHSGLTILTPPGTPGNADFTITTPEGTTTVPGGFQYVRRAETFAFSGGGGQIIHDRPRDRLYITNPATDQVEVFSLSTREFLTPLPTGSIPLGVTQMPDGSLLAVANLGSKDVTLIDLDGAAGSITIPVLTEAEMNSTCKPAPIWTAATSQDMVFVSIPDQACTGANTGLIKELDLPTLTLKERDELRNTSSSMPMTNTPDGTTVLVGIGARMPNSVLRWDELTDTFRVREASSAVSISDDGLLVGGGFGVYDKDLMRMGVSQEVRILNRAARNFFRLGMPHLHPSGALLYVPNEKGVDIFDSHRGRLVLSVAFPESLVPALDSLAIDEFGRRLFALTESGLTIVELDSVPLGIGTVTPEQGMAIGGTQVTIRGSGFKVGAVVKFGDAELLTTFVDENTLHVITPSMPAGTVRVTITNSDGEEYYLDAGYRFTN